MSRCRALAPSKLSSAQSNASWRSGARRLEARQHLTRSTVSGRRSRISRQRASGRSSKEGRAGPPVPCSRRVREEGRREVRACPLGLAGFCWLPNPHTHRSAAQDSRSSRMLRTAGAKCGLSVWTIRCTGSSRSRKWGMLTVNAVAAQTRASITQLQVCDDRLASYEPRRARQTSRSWQEGSVELQHRQAASVKLRGRKK